MQYLGFDLSSEDGTYSEAESLELLDMISWFHTIHLELTDYITPVQPCTKDTMKNSMLFLINNFQKKPKICVRNYVPECNNIKLVDLVKGIFSRILTWTDF